MKEAILKALRETIVIGNPESLKFFEKRLDEILARESTTKTKKCAGPGAFGYLHIINSRQVCPGCGKQCWSK